MSWDTVIAAFGLLLLFEGLMCLLAPSYLRKVMLQLLEFNSAVIQRIGIVAALAGAAILWMIA